MTKVNSMAEAEDLLAKYVPLARTITGKDITVDRTMQLMEVLGNPQKRLKIIHIAGTSGKTSTAYFAANLLKNSGQKVGLTVSPHIDTVRERIQINLSPISEKDFIDSLNEVTELLNKSDVDPTYFELMIGFAYWYFDKEGVDYAVVETGLGGTHDSTNVADNPDKVCAITDIGLDHMHVLGSTVPEIARQKAGIIREKNTVFMHEQEAQIMSVIKERCSEANARLFVVPEYQTNQDLPRFQHRNWSLAYEVFKYIKNRDNLPVLAGLGSQIIKVPARMEKIRTGAKEIIMDGAHNEQKMQAFVESFISKYQGKKVPVLVSLKMGKEFAAVLPLLKQIASTLILTEYQKYQDLPIASFNAEELAAAADKFGFEEIIVEKDKDKAYQMLLEKTTDVAVITGSFYLIGQLRQNHVELAV